MSAIHSALSSSLLAAIKAGATVVVPTQRTAHWLKLLYAQTMLSEGRRAWATPAIQSFGAFALQLWRQQGGAQERVLTTEQARLLWDRVVQASPWSARVLSAEAAGASAFQSWERLQAWRIERSELTPFSANSDEARALLDWCDRFHELCREKRWLPSALVPQRLRELGCTKSDLRIVTIASHELTPDQRALLAHLQSGGATWTELQLEKIRGTCRVVACASQDQELSAAATWARDQFVSGKKSIGIVIPDLADRAAQVERIFADVFAQSQRTFGGENGDRPFNHVAIASYRKLGEFHVVRAALDLLQFTVGRAASALAGQILRNPFLRASESEASQRALADARLRAHSREHYDLLTLEHIASASHCAVLQSALHEAQMIRRNFSSRALPSAMAEHFLELWRAFGWPGECALDSDEQQAMARLQTALGEFGALDELLGPLTYVNAVREFERLTRDIYFEPRRLPAPVTIVDTHSAPGLRFEAAWVCGVDESRWPPPPAPDAFIPIELQKRARMPFATALLAREQAQAHWSELNSIANQVRFSWATRDGDSVVLPSPWLRDIEREEASSNESVGYAEKIFLAKPRLDVIEESAAPTLTQQLVRGGARIFELQSLCPFRAFAELRLLARPLEQIAPDIDARDRGSLIHAALADVWRTLADSATLNAQTREQLEVLVRTTLARHAAPLAEGGSAHRMRMLQIEQELAAERLLALLEIDRQRSAFKIVGMPEEKERVTLHGLSFEVRLDRMDELLEEPNRGARVIVDYKTGGNLAPQSWRRDRPEQPQLPLYAVLHPEALAAVVFAMVSARGVNYAGVARSEGVIAGIKAFAGKANDTLANWDDLIAHWNSVIARLATEFAGGNARIDPLPMACRYCHASILCRIDERRGAGLLGEEDDAA